MTAVVLRGDARCLPLPDASVDLVVTSPPYFGLRSYTDGGEHYDGQIGSESTPQEWLAVMTECVAEMARVLKPSGSIFINVGDKYVSQGGRNSMTAKAPNFASYFVGGRTFNDGYRAADMSGYPVKSLLGLPWRLALACTDQLGLILRRDIIWSKPNGLPESVTDRCRSSHEYVFHMTKSPRYYSAVDEIREAQATIGERHGGNTSGYARAPVDIARAFNERTLNPLGKLPGSVWSIPSQPLTVPAHLGTDHFAAFPMELPRRCILGWSPPGICTACGEGRRPVTDSSEKIMHRPHAVKFLDNPHGAEKVWGRNTGNISSVHRITSYACACGEEPACRVNANGAAGDGRWVSSGSQSPDGTSGSAGNARVASPKLPPTRPAVILDPFGGTGTTALVASMLGRTGVSIDRSADYCRLARWRTTDPSERARAMQVPKPPPVPAGQVSLFDLDGEAS